MGSQLFSNDGQHFDYCRSPVEQCLQINKRLLSLAKPLVDLNLTYETLVRGSRILKISPDKKTFLIEVQLANREYHTSINLICAYI